MKYRWQHHSLAPHGTSKPLWNYQPHKKIRVTNCRRYQGNDTHSNGPRMPSTMQGEKNHTHYTGHQKANTLNSESHNKANKLVQIDNMQKSTYNAKFSNTEVTALFNSGIMLSCISK